jgi:hypothetical protein
VPVKYWVVENAIRVLYERYVNTDLEALVYPSTQPEISKIGLTIEPDRLCFRVLDLGVVYDGECDSVVVLSVFAECRVLQGRQSINMQERMLVSKRKTVHAAAPPRYTDHQQRQRYNRSCEIYPAHLTYFDPDEERREIPKST